MESWLLVQLSPQHTLPGGVWQEVHLWAEECHRSCLHRTSPRAGGKHYLISTGKNLTQDKLADCKVYLKTVLHLIANVNRGEMWGQDLPQSLGTHVPSCSLLRFPASVCSRAREWTGQEWIRRARGQGPRCWGISTSWFSIFSSVPSGKPVGPGNHTS